MLDWAKAIHEAIGIESPKTFITVFALIGLVLFAFVGWMIDRGYRVKLRQESVHAASLQDKPPPTAAGAPLQKPPAPRGSSESTALPQPAPAKKTHNEPKTDRSVRIGDGNTITDSPIITGDVHIGDPGRAISQSDGEAAVSELAAYKGTRFVIHASMGTSEPDKFARQIMEILIDAEWAPKQRSVIPSMSAFAGGPPPPGILILTTEALMPAATALVKVLRKVDPSVLCQNNGREDIVKISVLPKP
jgi:hypothetical protein